jgi:hypothetical protein
MRKGMPTNTRTISTLISALIEDKLKQQIWKDQYIDLALLLPQNNTSTNEKGLFNVIQGEPWLIRNY